MTDKYLCDRLAPRNPWGPDVYKETSGYIHFSKRHIDSSFNSRVDNLGQICIGPSDPDRSIGYYENPLQAFLHVNMMIPVAAQDWFERLKQGKT